MNDFRDLMNLMSYLEESATPQPTPEQEHANEELMEAMRRVEELFDY